MLPDPRQVGEPQIDHLDLLVLDRLEDIFDCDTIRNHGFAPATERGRLEDRVAVQPCPIGLGRILVHVPPSAPPPHRPRSGMAAPAFSPVLSRRSRQLQLWCGPPIGFLASSICRPLFATWTS